MKRILFSLAVLLCAVGLMAQDQAPRNWWELDRTDDSFPGVSAAKAHNYLQGKTAHKVVVAVIDSGVDIEHEDLKEVIWTNPGEVPDNGIDDDNNGYVDDYNGWNVGSNNDNIAGGGHGTSVSGMIGAIGNNGSGGAGVNWDVDIMQVDMAGGLS
ncbi:MAG: S8 family serine peptidase, partial [Bacteroidota bacterium]